MYDRPGTEVPERNVPDELTQVDAPEINTGNPHPLAPDADARHNAIGSTARPDSGTDVVNDEKIPPSYLP